MTMEELKKEIEGEEKVIIHTQVLYDLMKQIEKQQKEIERLKKSISNERKLAEAQITYDMDEMWKSKIQDKIDELEQFLDYSQGCMLEEELNKEFVKLQVLKELLESEE